MFVLIPKEISVCLASQSLELLVMVKINNEQAKIGEKSLNMALMFVVLH